MGCASPEGHTGALLPADLVASSAPGARSGGVPLTRRSAKAGKRQKVREEFLSSPCPGRLWRGLAEWDVGESNRDRRRGQSGSLECGSSHLVPGTLVLPEKRGSGWPYLPTPDLDLE